MLCVSCNTVVELLTTKRKFPKFVEATIDYKHQKETISSCWLCARFSEWLATQTLKYPLLLKSMIPVTYSVVNQTNPKNAGGWRNCALKIETHQLPDAALSAQFEVMLRLPDDYTTPSEPQDAEVDLQAMNGTSPQVTISYAKEAHAHGTVLLSEVLSLQNATAPHLREDPRLGSLSKKWNYNPEFIRNCYQDCSSNHKQCLAMSSISLDWYPMRLIYIGERNEDVKLFITGEPALPPDRYATLSHRWPRSELNFPTLLKRTLSQFLEHIDVGSLQRTFQEAIDVARQLEYHYIWIDSLCIVQDDKEDCAVNISQMDRVYMNGELHISATGIADNSESMFRRRPDEYFEPSLIKDEAGRAFEVYEGGAWNSTVTNAPLTSRGWVFQERLLSPRTIHLGGTQMAWECLETRQTEGKINGNIMGHKTLTKSEVYSILTEPDVPINTWVAIVGNFSALDLTVAEDKLTALSGIVNYISKAKSDEYFHGMWKSSIHLELAWTRSPNDRKRFPYHLTRNRAPSWSWASVDGRIAYPTPEISSKWSEEEPELAIHFDLEMKDLGSLIQASVAQSSVKEGFSELLSDKPESRSLFLHGCILCRIQVQSVSNGVLNGVKVNMEDLEDFGNFRTSAVVDTSMVDSEIQRICDSGLVNFVPIYFFSTGFGGILITPKSGTNVYCRIGSLRVDRFYTGISQEEMFARLFRDQAESYRKVLSMIVEIHHLAGMPQVIELE